MSKRLQPGQYAHPKGTIAETHQPHVTALAEGSAVPADGTTGFESGSLFIRRAGAAGAQLYVNEGTSTSCAFKPFASQASAVALPVAGVAAGYKIARGQATTVTAADTIATGLATVVAVVASLESDPTDDPFMVTAQIGDQAGSPVAGSIIIKTWKNTGGTDPTPLAATTFSKKVNWIAIGT